MSRIVKSMPLALMAAMAWPDKAADACNFEGCPNLPESCYSYYYSDDHTDGVRWCQTASYRDCPNGVCGTYYYTPVNYANHSGMPDSIVDAAATELGYPPAGPANSLLLVKATTTGSGHDIDVWNASLDIGTWGSSSWDFNESGQSCFSRGTNAVYFDMSHIGSGTANREWITRHELGHSVGLGHVCTNNVMNPCSGPTIYTSCDATGINSLYHNPLP
jgi:hypothetical protein